MPERIEADPACPPGRVVAEVVGDKAMRGLVKGHRKHDGHDPGADLVKVH